MITPHHVQQFRHARKPKPAKARHHGGPFRMPGAGEAMTNQYSVNSYNPPVTDAERAQIRRLHAEGVGRNEIARRLGRGPRTISMQCERMGLTFDRTMTAVATEARVTDAKARRAAIQERLYTRIEKLLTTLESAEEGDFKYTAATGAGIATVILDHVPGQEEKALAGALTQYLGQAMKLEAMDAGSGHDEDRGILAGIAKALGWQAPGGSGED